MHIYNISTMIQYRYDSVGGGGGKVHILNGLALEGVFAVLHAVASRVVAPQLVPIAETDTASEVFGNSGPIDISNSSNISTVGAIFSDPSQQHQQQQQQQQQQQSMDSPSKGRTGAGVVVPPQMPHLIPLGSENRPVLLHSTSEGSLSNHSVRRWEGARIGECMHTHLRSGGGYLSIHNVT